MEKGYLLLVLHAHLPFVRHPEFHDFLEEDSMRVRRIAEHNDGAVWMSKTGSIFSNRNF